VGRLDGEIVNACRALSVGVLFLFPLITKVLGWSLVMEFLVFFKLVVFDLEADRDACFAIFSLEC